MKKLITLILGIAFLFGCTSNNNSNSDSTTYSYTQGEIATDIEGNTYPTIVTNCSNQRWMQKNLNVSRYKNGDVIPQVTDPAQWNGLTTGAWCYYNNNSILGPIYGKLYNWFAVIDPRGLAPQGWHIPSDAEWTTFTTCLGGDFSPRGELVAGGKMKEVGTTHWQTPNTDATNTSGFSGLPGGLRQSGGSGFAFGLNGAWWSSTSLLDNQNAYSRYLSYDWGQVNRGTSLKYMGFSIRCIKD